MTEAFSEIDVLDVGRLLLHCVPSDPYVDVALVGGHVPCLSEPRFIDFDKPTGIGYSARVEPTRARLAWRSKNLEYLHRKVIAMKRMLDSCVVLMTVCAACMMGCMSTDTTYLPTDPSDWDAYPVPADPGDGNEWQLQPLSDGFNYTAQPANKGTQFTDKWVDTYHNAWLGPGRTEWSRDHLFQGNRGLPDLR